MLGAVIDIGSSSIKLIIGEQNGEELRILESLKNIVDIGTNTFYKGRISQPIINKTIGILAKYKQVIEQYEVDAVKVIATTAVRESTNRDIFLDAVQRKTGFEIEVLNVGDVVYYIDSFLSFKLKKSYPIHEKNVMIAELGAGSLDVSLMEHGFTLMNVGVPAGTLRLKQFKNRLDGSQSEIYHALDEYVDNQVMILKKSFPNINIDDVILIDEGYSSSLTQVIPNAKKESSFFKLKQKDAQDFLQLVTKGNLDDLAREYKIPVSSAHTIDAYATILNKLYKFIRGQSIYILETSLSEALLANMIFGIELAKRYNKTNQLVSVAKFLCSRFDLDIKHNRYVAQIAEQLFDKVKDSLGLDEEDKLYLTLASYMHNIGSYINNRAQHKHTEFIVKSMNFFRLTDDEIKIIACVARYHRRNTPQRTHYLYGSMNPEQRILIQKLSSILRMANALDASHKQKIKSMDIVENQQGLKLNVVANENFVLERLKFDDMKGLFEELSGNKISIKDTR